MDEIQESFHKLRNYCEKAGFKGWDPYDGLNSRIFQSIPFVKKSRLVRLAWIQFFKLSPLNLRPLLMVPKEWNPKGIALFLNGYCHLYRADPRDDYLERIRNLGHRLISLRSEGYHGACWGYNFDWQARAFFQPRYTPTVVATTFAAYALLDAWEITGDDSFRKEALSTAGFILKDLNRTYDEDGDLSFSYSPQDRTRVFNATLLGSRMLARIYAYNGKQEYLENARKSVSFCCKHQKEDGSWTYSTLPWHQWADSFHTGYNLECIYEYQKYSGDTSFDEHLWKGFDYYIRHFFTPDGIPRYYDHSVYPVDVHATAQLIVTLDRLGKLDEYRDLAERVLSWTIHNMQAGDGHFFYRKTKYFTSRIPYMRWSQGWMFYAMSVFTDHFSRD